MILVIFLLAYGVSTFALRFPDQPFSGDLMKQVVYYPYWQIYGEIYLDQLEGLFSLVTYSYYLLCVS